MYDYVPAMAVTEAKDQNIKQTLPCYNELYHVTK